MLPMFGALEYVTLMLLNLNSVAVSAMSWFPILLISSVEGLFGWCGREMCRSFCGSVVLLSMDVMDGFFG